MASILILKGINQGQRIELDREKLIIGRNPDCDVIVPGNAVSRQHAQIVRAKSQFFLEDLQSRNKTFLNNQEIAGRVALKDNDRIKICDFLCTYHERPQLPEALRKNAEEFDEEDPNSPASTVLSTVEAVPDSHLLLEAQPAEKLRILLEITNGLTKTLELDTLLPKVIDSLFQIFKQADRGFVIIQDETTGRLVPKALKTRREKDESTANFSRRIVKECMQKGQAFLTEDAFTDPRFNLSQSVSDFRIRSVMCAPLRSVEGHVFGVIQLDNQDRNKKFNQEDLQLLVAVSNQAAVAMESAKMHEDAVARDRLRREIELAKQVQRGFLPSVLPVVPEYEFFAHYEAARDIGGDFYVFIPLPDQRLSVIIADVAGKGVPAALLMAKLSSDARYCVLTEPNPAKAVTQLNDLLNQSGRSDRFVTLAMCVLDTRAHTITVVNAGHMPPIVRRAATGTLEEVAGGSVGGLPLGVMEGYEYQSCECSLAAGDVVVLWTDGVTDAMSVADEPFEKDRLNKVLQSAPSSPPQLGQQLLRAVVEHAAGQSQSDDITLVCFGRCTSPAK